MATSYPSGIDTFVNPSASSSQTSPSHAGLHTNANDAIRAIQTELGTNPRGSETDVAARFTALTRPGRASVFRNATNTVAIANGTVVSSLATTAANNVTVIQAAIDAVAGARVNAGYSGGGSVVLGDSLFQINAPVTLKYGVHLQGSSNGLDRGAGTYSNTLAGSTGTVIKPVVAGQVVVQVGTTAGATTRVAANPHGCSIRNITFDGASVATCIAISLIDTADFKVANCEFSSCSTGIKVDSTLVGNSGGTVATKIDSCNFMGSVNAVNLPASAVGASDGEVFNCRILNSSGDGLLLGSGGWQILQCHMTTGSGGGSHINAINGLCLVVNNYLDTVGNSPQITCSGSQLHVVGNYFKASDTRNAGLIVLTATGYRSVISNNVVNTGAATSNFVTTPNTPTISTQALICSGNSINITGNTSWVTTVRTDTNVTVADQDTTGGPYIRGNRTWP